MTLYSLRLLKKIKNYLTFDKSGMVTVEYVVVAAGAVLIAASTGVTISDKVATSLNNIDLASVASPSSDSAGTGIAGGGTFAGDEGKGKAKKAKQAKKDKAKKAKQAKKDKAKKNKQAKKDKNT